MKVDRFHVGARLSEMAIHHGTVYLAGQIAEDASQDMEGQTRQVLGAIDKLLTEAGTDKTRVLMAQIFVSDMRLFGDMNKVWDGWVVAGQTPPRATVEAKLATPRHLVEIVVTAAQKYPAPPSGRRALCRNPFRPDCPVNGLYQPCQGTLLVVSAIQPCNCQAQRVHRQPLAQPQARCLRVVDLNTRHVPDERVNRPQQRITIRLGQRPDLGQ